MRAGKSFFLFERDVFEYLRWKEKRLEEISILALFEKKG